MNSDWRPTAHNPPPSSRNIPQPPHTSGQRFKGLRSLLDPSQIPSAVRHALDDEYAWKGRRFRTGDLEADMPLSGTDVPFVDEGNATPRFIRLSTYAMPSTHDLALTCAIPLGFVLQPFAEQPQEEEPIPVATFETDSPPRCDKCGAYINPWVLWSASGQSWTCNLCESPNQVSVEYFSPLGHSGRRADHDKRPELNRGTVDFVVPEKYYATQPRPRLLPSYASSPDTPRQSMSELETRPPIPLRTLFVIDVSSGAISNGTVQSVCDCIRDALYGGSPNELNTINGPPYAFMQVGFLTFSDSLHFYDLSPNLLQPGMLVVADVDEVFVPTREGLFVDPLESRVVIESLLNSIPTIFAETPMPHAALCASLQGGLATLARTGGQMLVFASTFPNYGPGILQPRVDNEVYNTSKEKTLWEPQDIAWKELAEECAESGVGVNLWAFPDRLMDIGTIGAPACTSGGEIFFHPRYRAHRDEHVLLSEIRRTLTRHLGYNCSVRVRCSNGLHVSSYASHLFQPTPETLTAGILSADSSIAGLLSHNNYGPAPGGGLDDRRDAYLQAAVLYTTVEGERRVRVCNIGFKPSTLAGNVFKRADQDTGVCLLAKEAALAMSRKMLSEIREDLTQRFVDLLVGYRRNCAASTAHTQLILPESYKLLPVLGNAILKTQALKGGPVSSDVRCVSRSRILSAGVQSLMTYLYPRITPIHAAPHNRSLLDVHRMPATYTKMVSDGAYLMDNGEVTILWLGGAVSPQILLDLFGVDDWDTLGPAVNALPPLDTPLSSQLRDLIRREEARRGGRTVPFLVARQNLDAAEIEFGNLLVEDENNDAMSYMDYLCHLHRQISDTLSKGQGWNLWS